LGDTQSRLFTPDSNADPAQAELVEASIRLGGAIQIRYEGCQRIGPLSLTPTKISQAWTAWEILGMEFGFGLRCRFVGRRQRGKLGFVQSGNAGEFLAFQQF
jgi:hypothetical protein